MVPCGLRQLAYTVVGRKLPGMSTSLAFSSLFLAASLSLVAGCAATSHSRAPAVLGVTQRASALEAVLDQPGPITVETVAAAEWEVSLSGLVNLDHSEAKAAHLVDHPEPIVLFVHVLRHPDHGMYIVDTGVERSFVSDRDHALVHGLVGSLAHVDKLKVHEDTAALLAREHLALSGVFLTHLHLDHILGLRDVPASTPVYVGAGDASETSFMNLFVRGIYNDALEGKDVLQEVQFTPDADRSFDGVKDVFGDGSLWALWVPGHTAGSIAFVARTPNGPVLLTGDACHTAWGWDHGVEPGTFSENQPQSAVSLAHLKSLVARHPKIDVRLGHQYRTGTEAQRR